MIVPDVRPAVTDVLQEAVYTFLTNSPIQSPLIDLEADFQDTVKVLPAVAEVGTFKNDTAKEEEQCY